MGESIIFGICVGDPSRYESTALPSIRRAAAGADLVLAGTGEHGLCRAYNEFVEEARRRPDCAALVLLHDDVELLDPDFRTKALAAVADPSVGIAGVIGGSGLRDHAWWRARRTAGFVLESRGPIVMGPRQADVDVVDGLLLIVAPAAFRTLGFDEARFPSFHGYDVDYCLQARDAGLRVVVTGIDVSHHPKGGYGDKEAWRTAGEVLAEKWPRLIRRPGPAARAGASAARAARHARGALRRVRRASGRLP